MLQPCMNASDQKDECFYMTEKSVLVCVFEPVREASYRLVNSSIYEEDF